LKPPAPQLAGAGTVFRSPSRHPGPKGTGSGRISISGYVQFAAIHLVWGRFSNLPVFRVFQPGKTPGDWIVAYIGRQECHKKWDARTGSFRLDSTL